MGLRNEIVKVVSEVTNIPEESLSEESGLGNAAGWDSLSHTNLVLELEERFDVAFEFDELDKVVTIRAIEESLKEKGVLD